MSLDPREFRNALGRFATGVCVITAKDSQNQPFGMTVNSFASLSLDPPLVLWSIQKNSECFDTINQAKFFSVNILSAEQQAVSNQYAKKGEHTLQDGTFTEKANGCLVLDDVMTSFECALEARYEGGDHIIIVGRALAMNNGQERDPLLFYAGKYRQLKAAE